MLDEKPSRRVLIFDGECPMCQGAVGFLTHWGLLATTEAAPWQELGIQDEALTERVRGELLLLDPQTGDAEGGFFAITQLMRRTPRYQGLGKWLQKPLPRAAGEWLYPTIALNRRILSPPNNGGMACTCDPPLRTDIQVRFYSIMGTLYVIGPILYGVSMGVRPIAPFCGLPFADGLGMLVGWTLAWLPLIWLAGTLRAEQSTPLRQQGLVIATIGSLWLLAGSLLLLIAQRLPFPIPHPIGDAAHLLPFAIALFAVFQSLKKRAFAFRLRGPVSAVWLALFLLHCAIVLLAAFTISPYPKPLPF